MGTRTVTTAREFEQAIAAKTNDSVVVLGELSDDLAKKIGPREELQQAELLGIFAGDWVQTKHLYGYEGSVPKLPSGWIDRLRYEAAASPGRGQRSRLWVYLGVIAGIIALLGGVASFLVRLKPNITPGIKSPTVPGEILKPNSALPDLSPFIWPFVVLVALGLVYLLVRHLGRQALSGTDPVDIKITWKVVQIAEGRIELKRSARPTQRVPRKVTVKP